MSIVTVLCQITTRPEPPVSPLTSCSLPLLSSLSSSPPPAQQHLHRLEGYRLRRPREPGCLRLLREALSDIPTCSPLAIDRSSASSALPFLSYPPPHCPLPIARWPPCILESLTNFHNLSPHPRLAYARRLTLCPRRKRRRSLYQFCYNYLFSKDIHDAGPSFIHSLIQCDSATAPLCVYSPVCLEKVSRLHRTGGRVRHR